jgi:hypothetical protein
LEAIYHDCVLILHKEWVDKGPLFQDKKNCYVVGYTEHVGQEIATIINTPIGEEYFTILAHSKLLLQPHIL